MPISGIYYKLRHKSLKREVKFLYQRLTRGWDDGETFSLDYSLAKLIAPRLRKFSEIRRGYPSDMTDKEWQIILDKMIAAFEFAGSEASWDAPPSEFEKHQEGINLFAKFFHSLWW